jgi:D-glycerate 3-kinase
MLMTRGVPGTHDVQMMLNFFKKAKSKSFKKIELPNFNKGRWMTDLLKRIGIK